MALACTVTPTATPTPASPMYSKKEAIAVVKKHLQASAFCELTGFSCARPRQSHTFQGMGFHYRFSRGDRVQIISGKHKGATGTVDSNVFQRSVDFPIDHTPCHHVLLDNDLVITINVNQVEALNEIVPPNTQGSRDVDFERRLQG